MAILRFMNWTRAACLLAAVALAGCGLAAREGIGDDHEAALQYYLSASRTLIEVRDSFIPMAIQEGAVGRWGFDAGSLDTVRVARIRSYGDEAALLDYVAALHVRNLTAYELREAAKFLETEAGQPAPSPADRKRRFDDFIQSPVGVRVEEFDGFLSRELPRALVDYADRAIEIYVREQGLPNRRKAVP